MHGRSIRGGESGKIVHRRTCRVDLWVSWRSLGALAGGRGAACLDWQGRGRRHDALPRILHRQHPQSEHARGLRARRRRVPALVRRAGDSARSRGQAGACRRVYRAARQANVGALGQAAPRLHPHAVRLAGHRPGDAVEPRAFRPGAAPFGEQGRDAGALFRRSNGAARRAWMFQPSWGCATAPSSR